MIAATVIELRFDLLAIVKILIQEDMLTFEDCLQTLRDVQGRTSFALVSMGCNFFRGIDQETLCKSYRACPSSAT